MSVSFLTDLISDEDVLYRGVSVVISLFIFDVSFEINEPMMFGLNEPICEVLSGVCGSSDELD